MGLTLKTRTREVVLTQERTYELTVHNRIGEVPRIEAKREQIEKSDDQVQLLTDAIRVRRNFYDISNETIDLVGRPGDPITIGQLWATIAMVLDRWAMADDPAKANAVAAEPEDLP